MDKRTFIAIPLPEEIREELAGIQRELSSCSEGIAWLRPELMHITLKFLGDTPERLLETVGKHFLESCKNEAPFRLKLHQTGYFPREGEPRVLWAGLQNIPGRLYRLSDELNTVYVSMGFDDTGKRFSPHITLGRVKRKTHPDFAERFLSFHVEEKDFIADRIIWYESCHKNGKLTYLPLEEYKLLK